MDSAGSAGMGVGKGAEGGGPSFGAMLKDAIGSVIDAGRGGQRCAQRRHGQRFPGTDGDLLHEHGREIGREKLRHESAHAARGFKRKELAPLQVER
eukprot:gene41847-56669_t